ncbi:MAG: LysR substrate-binding domain-containing protein [Azospirillaceae bacterium]|nr:LysR substrate-binding domain-containing protein [Azospirillaceae bacterium]
MSFGGLSFRDLEYLVAVAEHRHFGRAAAWCGVSQPGLSAQVAKVEAVLGVAVFERTGKGAVPTRFGDQVLQHAVAVLAQARALLDLPKAWTEAPAGPLALGAIQTLGPYLFPHILRPLRDRFPALELRLEEGRTEGLLADLRAARLDAVLLALPAGDPSLTEVPLFFEPFVVAAPSDWHRDIDPGSDDGLLLLEEGHCLRDQALAACAAPRSAPGRRHATGLETLRHMVASGAGWTLMPALAAGATTTMAGLIQYQHQPAGTSLGRTIGMVWRRRDTRAAHHIMIADFLRDLDLPSRAASADHPVVAPHRRS